MIVFVSNYYNHHQSSFCTKMFELTGDNYRFIATEPIEAERLKMGWEEKRETFVLQYTDCPDECQQLIDNASTVIYGSAPYKLIKNRIKTGKLVLVYSERLFKNYNPRTLVSTSRLIPRYLGKKNIYLLCASAYAASDYNKVFLFRDKCYTWGYYTKLNEYTDVDRMIGMKHSASILWAARLIEYKHPEKALKIARRLKSDGYQFEINIIGNGTLEDTLKKDIQENDLFDCVKMLGAMSPDQVRIHMEQSQIFLFTSDRNEGWGAVLNESMNSACAVVASRDIGSVPFLVKNEKNGLTYEDNDFDQLYHSVKRLLDDDVLREKIGKNAYYSIHEMWNAENAAKRLLVLIEDLKTKGSSNTFTEGPCSISR